MGRKPAPVGTKKTTIRLDQLARQGAKVAAAQLGVCRDEAVRQLLSATSSESKRVREAATALLDALEEKGKSVQI